MSFKRILKRSCIPIASLLLAILVIFPSVNTNALISTASPASPGDYLTARWVSVVLECLQKGQTAGIGGSTKGTLTSNEADKFEIFVDREGGPDSRVDIGHDLEYDDGVSDGDDGVASCAEIQKPAKAHIEKAFGSALDFVKLFYDRNPSGSGWKLKADPTDQAEEMLSSQFIQSTKKGDVRKIRLAVAFSKCFDEASSGTATVDSDTPDLTKAYNYLDGRGPESTVTVGTLTGDGVYKCKTLLNLAKEEGLVDFMRTYNVRTGTLRNNPQHLYANVAAGQDSEEAISEARTAILEILDANPDIVTVCLTKAGLSSIPNSSIAEWLMTGDDSLISVYTGSASSRPATESETSTLMSCLMSEDALGNELRPVLEELEGRLAEIEAELEASLEETEDASDDCLKNDDFFGWIVCPIINGIDAILETLEDYIQEMLQFKLDDELQGEGLRNAWNVFRSLSTVLIMIGFLVALLVKTIKGD